MEAGRRVPAGRVHSPLLDILSDYSKFQQENIETPGSCCPLRRLPLPLGLFFLCLLFARNPPIEGAAAMGRGIRPQMGPFWTGLWGEQKGVFLKECSMTAGSSGSLRRLPRLGLWGGSCLLLPWSPGASSTFSGSAMFLLQLKATFLGWLKAKPRLWQPPPLLWNPSWLLPHFSLSKLFLGTQLHELVVCGYVCLYWRNCMVGCFLWRVGFEFTRLTFQVLQSGPRSWINGTLRAN